MLELDFSTILQNYKLESISTLKNNLNGGFPTTLFLKLLFSRVFWDISFHGAVNFISL